MYSVKVRKGVWEDQVGVWEEQVGVWEEEVGVWEEGGRGMGERGGGGES